MSVSSTLRAPLPANASSYGAPSKRRRNLGFLLALAMAGTTAAAADELPGAFHGDAYATFGNAKAGPVATSLARSAFQGCSCEGTGGETLSSKVSDVSAGSALSANVTRSTALTQKTDTTADVRNTSTIDGLNALGGMITADSVKAVASVSATASTMTASSDGSVFKNLVIDGQKIPNQVAPNTVVALPGVGSATLNNVTQKDSSKNKSQILVEMLTIDVKTRNSFNLPVGSKIVVAHASAGFARKHADVVFDGEAYAALANDSAGNELENKIGKGAAVALACDGTSGKTKTNSVEGQDVSGIMTTSDGATTAFGGKEGGAEVARTTSTISNVNLLGGVITANAIQAVAQSSIKDGVVTGSADGSGFSGLSVAGVAVPADTPPNTKLDLPGIGNVVVNEQIVKKDGSVKVNGLHLTVTNSNVMGLPVGTELTIAHAGASVAPF
jgi:hypothetical protein